MGSNPIHSTKQSGGGIWCLNREIWNQNANHAWRTTGSNPVLTTKIKIMKKKIKVWWHDFCTDPCYYIVIFLGLLLLSIICTGGISSIFNISFK